MKMTLSELESCVGLLLRHARSRGVVEVDASRYDQYWKVLSEDCVNFAKQPSVSVGSLTDDINELHKLLVEPSRASVVDIDRLVALFSIVSQVLQDSPDYIHKTDS